MITVSCHYFTSGSQLVATCCKPTQLFVPLSDEVDLPAYIQQIGHLASEHLTTNHDASKSHDQDNTCSDIIESLECAFKTEFT